MHPAWMYALKSAQRLSRAVRVEWEDGLSAQFTYVWLRDNSQRRPSLLHLDLNAKPQEVDYSDGKLSVVWPPFLPSSYSSRFLRDHSCVKPAQNISCPSTKKVLTVPWRIQSRPSFEDNSHMATIEWGERATEHGTVWPHFEKVPSIVTVETLTPNGKVHLVDAVTALTTMAQTHPDLFSFLSSNPIEYEHGFFKASHNVAAIQDNKVISAVFNNELRSSEITVNCLDLLYRSLKTFNRICCEMMHTIYLNPGDLLVVDNSQTFVGAPAQILIPFDES
uniref:DUF4524 domain-containing protein n=1 Tax=Heterorhabditis bacteriophora TaxID=37862 RepID=A0A1I7XNW6_HETBA